MEFFNNDFVNDVAEKNVLGIILKCKDDFKAINETRNILRPEDFYRQNNKCIYSAMLEMFDEKRKIDVSDLVSYLQNKRELEKCGGFLYITELEGYGISISELKTNIEYVKQEALRRAFQNSLMKAKEKLEAGEDIYSVIHECSVDLMNIETVKDEDIPDPFNNSLDVFIDIEQGFQDKQDGKKRGIDTGLVKLDRLSGGLQLSNFIIIGARPSVGKTALALKIASYIAVLHKIPVAFFSLEMSQNELCSRLFCMTGQVNSSDIRNKNLNEADFTRIRKAAEIYSKSPLFIDETPRLDITKLRDKATKLKAQKDIKLLIVDYLQLMTPENTGKNENREREVSKISRELKLLARELNIVVIALSQLNRGVETRKGDTPGLADLRESGSIEQDADIVMLLYKDKDKEKQNVIHLKIAKFRNGKTDDIKLYFHDEYCLFADLEPTEAEIFEQQAGQDMGKVSNDKVETFSASVPPIQGKLTDKQA